MVERQVKSTGEEPMNERRVQIDRRHKSLFTIDRVILVSTFVASVIGMVFGLGVQWAKTTVVEAKIEAVPKTYVTREIYDNDKQYIAQALDRLTKVIDKMNDRLESDEQSRQHDPRLPAFGQK